MMTRNIFPFLITMVSVASLLACPPAPDQVFYKGQKYYTFCPLHFYDYVNNQPGWSRPNSTAGYHAIWRITEDRLVLEGFSIDVRPELKKIMEDNQKGIPAHWFSGVIRLMPKSPGYESFSDSELHLFVMDGMVKALRWQNNERFISALKDIHQAQGRELKHYWNALQKNNELHPWLYSLKKMSSKEKISAVLNKQADMLKRVASAKVPPSFDDVLIIAHVSGLVYPDYLKHAFSLIPDESK